MRRRLLVLPLLAACIVHTVEHEAAEELGPEPDGDPSPTHRPGQPCLVCHGVDGDGRGEPTFAVAGTVYRQVSDDKGALGLTVELRDADGEIYRVETNRAGNFAFSLDSGVQGVVDDGEGIARIARAPRFPLTVVLDDGVRQKEMETLIQREGSCNACHAPTPSATSVGKVYFEEPSP